MKWEDVRRILDGDIPEGRFTAPNGASLSVEPALEADLSFFDERVSNVTEMEATARLLSFLKDAVLKSGDPQIRLHLQPSVDGHLVFTDFAFVTQAGEHVSLIEVKKASHFPSLTIESSQTAQVLREVHILLTVVSR